MSERMVVPIHGEDHCPGGPDPIPCLGTHWARVQKTYGSTLQTIAGDNGLNSVKCGLAGDAINIDAGESGEGYFTEVVAIGGGNPLIGLEPTLPGVYLVICELLWNETHNFAHLVGIADGAPSYHMSTGIIQPAFTTFSTFSTYKRWNGGEQVVLSVSQGSGSNKNIDAAFMELMLIGSWTGTPADELDPNQ